MIFLASLNILKIRGKNITKLDANCDFLWYNNSLGIQILQGIYMRKITVKFNKLQDIENLKKIMKNVYASNSDHLPDIAKFHLGDKIFIPNQVDKAELQ